MEKGKFLGMSRARKVLHSIGSSYVFLGVNVVFTLISVPLGLFYLSKAEFGLWALVVQISGYLSLIDVGISASVGRVLFDFKDDHVNPQYGEVIQTGALVLLAQGALLFVVGAALAPSLASLMNIPEDLQGSFISVLRWQCAVTAVGFATKMFFNLLAAHNRFDLVNYAMSLNLASSLLCLWLFLKWDYKLYSWIWANFLGWGLGSIVVIYCCYVQNLYPTSGAWGRASWKRFCELFMLAKDVFLMSVGSQFIMASQTLIVTRALGLEASAIWAVCTKTYTLVCQLTWRIYDFSGPALAEMIVRQERERFAMRIKDILTITASFSALVGIIFAVTNNAFVVIWTGRTGNPVSWPIINNVLLGIWLVIVAVLRCCTGQGLLTKQIGFLRYVYLIEGVIYFSLANILAPWGGFPVIIATSIVCSLVFSGSYSAWRMAQYLHIGMFKALREWFWPMCRMCTVLIPLGALVWYSASGLSAKMQFVLDSSILGLTGLFLLLRVGISEALQAEILHRVPKSLAGLFGYVFPAKASLTRVPAVK